MAGLTLAALVSFLSAAPGVARSVPSSDAPSVETAILPGSSSASDRDLECLAMAISYEAGNEPEAGQEAVAQVILNRLHDSAFPKTVCGVVYQGSERRTGCQFTFTCDGSLTRWQPSRSLANARRIAARALAGSLTSSIGAATFYHAYYVAPTWASRMERIARIGAHIFYRPLATALDVAREHSSGAPGTGTGTPDGAGPVATTLSVWGLKTAVLIPVGGRIEVRRP